MSNDDTSEPLSSLTSKQREVLDLLIQHKTSKQIARELSISPHTVDQRIYFAKRKLDASSRADAANAYRQLVELSERPIYRSSHVETRAVPLNSDNRTSEGLLINAETPDRMKLDPEIHATTDYRVVPEMLDGRFSLLKRLAAVVAISLAIVVVALSGLAVFGALSGYLAS